MSLDQMTVLSTRSLRSLSAYISKLSSRWPGLRVPVIVYLDRHGDFIAFELLNSSETFISRAHLLADLLAPDVVMVRCSLLALANRVNQMPLTPAGV